MSQSRQLAAIMFTDIVGYTALMGDDEHMAFRLLNRSRQIQRPHIEKHGGRWVKELGDGVLAVFSTGTDAVYAAVAIQKACAAEAKLKLRIGIHLGEVVFEDKDVFGDTVNIASRLQTLAPVGSILISESVCKNILNNKTIETKFYGAVELKNVKDPVRVYEVICNTTETKQPSVFPLMQDLSLAVQPKSIAVLPFVNMSNDPEQEYFSDGMAEEILNSLVHLKDLKVAGRTSSFQFKGRNLDLRELGEKLGVATVLNGSVRKQGNLLRITAQLINIQDGFHLWSEKFDRTMDDIFAIQDEIALAITEQLRITLFEEDREKFTQTTTHNVEAYELYLKGRFHMNRRGKSIITGLEYFKQAITVDPNYALAYAGYADANYLVAFYNFRPGIEIWKEVKQAAEMAIKLSDALAEAYCPLALYYMSFEWNWIESKSNFFKAIELNPKYAQTYSFLGLNFAWFEGRFEEAEKLCRIAVKLQPLSAIAHADLSWTLLFAQKFEEALVIARTGIDLDGDSFLSHRMLGLSYLALGLYDKAIATFSNLIEISDRHPHAINSLIWSYCKNGNYEEAKKLMNELREREATEYIGYTYLALSAAHIGDLDTAFLYLEQACLDRDPIVMQLKFDPYVPDLLRNDPRFQNLLDQIGFPK